MAVTGCLAAPLIAETFISPYCYPNKNKQIVVTVTHAALEKSPSWGVDADNPPLPARKALKLADEMKDSLVKDKDGYRWALRSLSLKQMDDEKWIWLVEYWLAGTYAGVPPTLTLAVLMDGTVVKPEVWQAQGS